MLDRAFSGGAFAELRDQFPDCGWNKFIDAHDDRQKFLEFTIDRKDCARFVRAHRNLGQHRGTLTFYKEFAVTALVPA